MNGVQRLAGVDDASAVPSAKPLGVLREWVVYGRSILTDIGHRLLRRRKRGLAQVSSDYDQGEWAQQLNARNWDRADTLEAYVERSWLEGDRTCLIDGRLWRMPSTEYYRFRRAKIASILNRFAGDVDELVEVGSGTGANLFSLYLDGPWTSLRGYELSATGRLVARQVAERFGVQHHISFDEIDLLDPASPGFAALQGATVFTYYCLEQLPNDAERIMRNLCRARVKRVIHLEPSFELLSLHSLRDLASASYVWRQDYQRSMLKAARRLEAEGLIRVEAVERLYYAPSWRHAPTLVVWEPLDRLS